MTIIQKHSHAVLKGSAATLAITVALIAGPQALAQSTAAAASDAQDIIVTGSRIARPELEATVPIAVITNRAIVDTGAGNIQDVLADLPSVGQNLSRTTSNFSNTGNGQATVNLRNLGDARTLVLVNGRRFVAGVPGTSVVDLNTIPTDLIKRVDVVTGGASAVYGSEAIAGVVNFTLDEDLEGVQGRLQGTLSDKGDAGRQYLSLGAGTFFNEGRGHVQVYGQYDNDTGLRSRERTFSKRDIPNRSSFADQGLFSVSGGFGSSGAGNSAIVAPEFDDDGVAVINTGVITFDGNNNPKAYESANIDGYNRNGDRFLGVPVKRYLGAASARYEVSDALTLYAEGQYARTESRSRLEPQAVANTDLPDEAGNAGAYAGIPTTNPFMTQAIRDQLAANAAALNGDADPDNDIADDVVPFRRRSNDIFDRSNVNERDTWRIVVGGRGEFGNGFAYDLYYTHGETRDTTTSGTVYGPEYRNALNAVAGPGGPVCSINVDSDLTNDDPACRPINIFGRNTVSKEAAAYVTRNGAQTVYDAKVKQDVLSGQITGSLFKLPGGPISFAVGAEYRKEQSSEDFDEATNLGQTLGNQLADTVGSFDVKEIFVETLVPVLREMPFAHELSFEAAARYADYSTVGGIWSWKVGGTWAPIRDVRFRAVYSEATRAPNIFELFSQQNETFPAVVDPCDQREGEGDGAPITKTTLSAACLAVPAIAAAAATPGGFVYTTADIQTINGFEGGNPDLKQETAKTFTAGVVLQPSFFQYLTASVDYYHIDLQGAVGIIGQQTSLDECYEGNGEALFCDNVIRGASGRVDTINAVNLNTGSYKVSGIDVAANFRYPFGEANSVNVAFNYNHRLKQEQTSYPGGPTQPEIGQLDCYSCGRLGTGFKDKFNLSTTLTFAPFSVNYRINYMGPVVDNLAASAPIRVGAYVYHDIQVRFDLDEGRKFGFYVGVDNLTDKTPPVFNDTNQVTYPGTQTAAGTYDLYGRMLYAGVNFKF